MQHFSVLHICPTGEGAVMPEQSVNLGVVTASGCCVARSQRQGQKGKHQHFALKITEQQHVKFCFIGTTQSTLNV